MSKTEDYRAQLAQQNAEIQALKKRIAETERQVFTDGLTSIFNRKKFNEDLSVYMATSATTCVVLVDIDHFKPFNDQYGHLVGDKVIQTVAQALKKTCETSQKDAQAYRFGGEEFAVLLPNTNIEVATRFADNIRDRVSRLNLTNKKTGEKLRPITTSLGVAQCQPGETIESLLERADQRLYDAKRSGRNCVRPALAS
nr:GGDEF domain-containing protein [Marinomonas ostreistagni]